MSPRLFLISITILAFLQGTILPPVFLEGLLLFWALSHGANLFLIFASGLIFDLVQTSPLGLNALVFLGFALAFSLLRGRIPLQNPLVAAGAITLFGILRSFVTLREVALLPIIFAALVTLFIFRRIYETPGKLKI